MNLIRNALIGGILLVAFLLFIEWNDFQQKQTAAKAPSQETLVENTSTPTRVPEGEVGSTSADLPALDTRSAVSDKPENAEQTPSTELIKVVTDSLDVLIDPVGGDIIKVSLPKYRDKLEDKDSEYTLLNRSANHTYVAESALFGPNGTHTRESGRAIYSASSSSYTLTEGEQSLTVDLITKQPEAQITKRFTFTRDSYLINIEYIVNNYSATTWKAAMYGRIKRDGWVPPADVGIGVKPYLGAALTTTETNYKKIDFDEIEDKPYEFKNQPGGWIAMVQHYFVSAWIPDATQQHTYTLSKSADGKNYLLGFTTPVHVVEPGEQETISAAFYAGPKIIKNLEAIAPHLDLTIDFGWLWFIAKPLFLLLDFIHDYVGNWGIAIILLTCIVKVVFFYPSAISYRSMAKMRKVMPMMQELKELYGDDRQRMGVETMKLYKKEGVNPLGGCLPMIMQMPVFIALYWALMESVELRHSPFFFWIQDLSVKDPYFVLPLIFGATMFFQQKLNPAPTDPMQAKIMQMMPIFFTFLFMMFPAGLVLYWVTNNALSITQQYIITKQIENSSA